MPHAVFVISTVMDTVRSFSEQSKAITPVVTAMAKTGIELGENGSIYPRPKGKGR